jgi:hypothetical protein
VTEHEHEAPLTEEEVAAANEPDETTAPEPDNEPEPETTPDNEPEADNEPESSAVMEEIGKKLDALTKTVATRISTILGENANDFEVCDLCSYWNTPGWRMKGQLPADLTAELLHVLNQHAPSDYIADTHSTVCSKCNGLGAVLSGSKAQGQELLPCIECQSRGWVPTDDARQAGVLARANGAATTGSPGGPDDGAMSPTFDADTPEIRALKAQGFVVIPPIAVG